MIYYKRALLEDEYEIAIGEKITITQEQITEANERLKNWADPPEYRIEDIVESKKPSIEKLVFLRQLKLIMDSEALEVGKRGGSTLYDVLVHDFNKNAKAIKEINDFAKKSKRYDVSKYATQKWKMRRGYSKILRENFVEKYTEYLGIYIFKKTKFRKKREI